MSVELRWLASRPASSLSAAEAIVRRRAAADTALAAALQEPTAALAAWCGAGGIELLALLANLIPLSATFDGPAQLAEVALNKTLGRAKAEPLAAALADLLRTLDTALESCRPRITDELELRSGPLREQWEARGPGLLAAIRRLTDPAVLVSAADVVLVHPLLGGHGQAWTLYNCVTLEAVLANPHPQLPEVVRLGWLLSQLNLELPALSEPIAPWRLPRVGPLAMLCAALAAAEEVELARADELSLAAAVRCWQLDVSEDDVEPLSAALWNWWTTYLEARPHWAAALAALDRLLDADFPLAAAID